jgi:hypothetical protein
MVLLIPCHLAHIAFLCNGGEQHLFAKHLLTPQFVLVQESPICEVLGLHQRQWLSSLMAQPGPSGQPPALRLIASGSVPFGSLGYVSDDEGLGVGPMCGTLVGLM